jgi:hypothetical protein
VSRDDVRGIAEWVFEDDRSRALKDNR